MGKLIRMKFNKKKMKNYYQISTLMFLLGAWRVYVVVSQAGHSVLFNDGGKLTSAYALLFFGFLFLVMGLLHGRAFYREKKPKA